MAGASSLLTQIVGTSMYPWQLTVLSVVLLSTIILALLAVSFMTSWWSHRDSR
jgi:Tfp pilus assembly protein PilX